MNYQPLKRLTVTLPQSLMDRLTAMRLNHRVSVSAIVEHIIEAHLSATPEAELMEHLVQRGASLRRNKTP